MTPRLWLERRWQWQQCLGPSKITSSRHPVCTAAATLEPTAVDSGNVPALELLKWAAAGKQQDQQVSIKHLWQEMQGQVQPGMQSASDLHLQQMLELEQQHEAQQLSIELLAVAPLQAQSADQQHQPRISQQRAMAAQSSSSSASIGSQHYQGISSSSSSSSSSRNSGVAGAGGGCSAAIGTRGLMVAIQQARTVDQLQQLYHHSRAQVDHIHLASFMHRLAGLWRSQCRNHIKSTKYWKRRHQHHADLPSSSWQTSNLLTEQQQHLEHQENVQWQQQQQQQQGWHAEQQFHQLKRLADVQRCAVPLLEQLLTDFLRRLSSCEPRHLSNCLWVLGSFHQAAAHSRVLQQGAAAVLQQLLSVPPPLPPAAAAVQQVAEAEAATSGPCSSTPAGVGGGGVQSKTPQGVVRAAEAAAAAGAQPASTGQQDQLPAGPVGSSAGVSLLHQGNLADLSNTLWALGRLGRLWDVSEGLPAGSLHQLELLCCQQLQLHASDIEAGRFLLCCWYGFAHLNRPVPQLFNTLTAVAGFNFVKRLQSHHVAVITWAAAKLGHHDGRLFDRLLWRAVVVRAALQLKHVAMLLWAAGKVGHAADARAVAQLLQVTKQRQLQLRGRDLTTILLGLMKLGLLPRHTSWFYHCVLPQVVRQLQELQPMGVAIVLRALLELETAAAQEPLPVPAAAAAGSMPWQGGAAMAFTLAPISQMYNGRSSSSTSSGLQELFTQQLGQPWSSQRPPEPAGPGAQPAAASTVGRGGKLASPLEKNAAVRPPAASRFPLLFREMNRHIAVQLPTTRPQTLYNIVICLARLGYYDARLYTKIVASLETAVATSLIPSSTAIAAATVVAASFTAQPILCQPQQQQQQQQQQELAAVHSMVSQGQAVLAQEHMLQLLCVCAHFQHPAPSLWLVVLPRLVAEHQQLQPQQLVVLMNAARHSAAGATMQECARLMPGLLQLVVTALQQQDDLNMLQLLQLAAAGTWVLVMAAELAYQPEQLQHFPPQVVQQLVQLAKQLHQLLPRLVSAALSQPQLLPLPHLPCLLQAAVQLQQCSSAKQAVSEAAVAAASSSIDTSWLQHYESSAVCVSHLSRLADRALDHLGRWEPSMLVTLMHCHCQPPLLDLPLADAYAEELHCYLNQASASTLLRLLQVLAAARLGPVPYSHCQLVTAAARQLHSKLLLVAPGQLRAVQLAMQQLDQQHTPLCRAVARLLAETLPDQQLGGAGHDR